jgi:hypothetical protein
MNDYRAVDIAFDPTVEERLNGFLARLLGPRAAKQTESVRAVSPPEVFFSGSRAHMERTCSSSLSPRMICGLSFSNDSRLVADRAARKCVLRFPNELSRPSRSD